MNPIAPGESLSSPLFGLTTFNLDFLRLGMWSPLQPFIWKVLNFYGLTLAQMSSNDWRCALDLWVLYKKYCRIDFSTKELSYFFTIKANLGEDHFDFFHLGGRSSRGKIIVGNPTFNKSCWKDKYFFIGGAWGQSYTEDFTLYLISSEFQEPSLLKP